MRWALTEGRPRKVATASRGAGVQHREGLTYKELSGIIHRTGIDVSPYIAVFSPHMLSQPLMLRNPSVCFRSRMKLAEITRIAIRPRHFDAPIVRLHERS